jgi:UDP-N-acetylmuramate dehydrogenase
MVRFLQTQLLTDKPTAELVREYTDLKAWKVENGYKISAAWLIEKSGFKQKLDPETGMTTWKNQPLVLVNKKAKHTQDLINYQEKIVDKIFEQFGISLEREPEILP